MKTRIKGMCIALSIYSILNLFVVKANAVYKIETHENLSISMEGSFNLKMREYQRKMELEKKIQRKLIEDNRRKLNGYYNQKLDILTSVYSTQEPIDNPAWAGYTASTVEVFDGVVAIPYDFPLFSVFLINNRIYLGLDRGNENIIKVYGEGDNKEQYMKIDVYTPNKSIPELLSIGVNEADCYVIRVGGSLENVSKDIENMNNLNSRGEVSLEDAYKTFLD